MPPPDRCRALKPALHDEGDAAEAEQQAERLAPGHALAEHHHGEQPRSTIGLALTISAARPDDTVFNAEEADAEKHRLVGDAERGEYGDVTLVERPADAARPRKRQHQRPGGQEAGGEEDAAADNRR